MSRRTSKGRGPRAAASTPRAQPAASGESRIHSLENESNIGIGDDGRVDLESLSTRQRIEEYEMKRRLWARVHWLDAFEIEPRQ